MPQALADFLDLTESNAAAQWERILARRPVAKGQRQEDFLPVEVLLCYGLFRVLIPRSYGGRNYMRAPWQLQALATTFRRSAYSLLSKMNNLDGSYAHAGRVEVELYARLAFDAYLAARLNSVVVGSARSKGLDALQVPDLWSDSDLGGSELLGQEEVQSGELEVALAESQGLARQWVENLQLSEPVTERIVEHRARLGQHVFASGVLRNFGMRCGFCGLSSPTPTRTAFLRASHVKPWRISMPNERLDIRNGIAACPNHDAAFDAGLLTVNGGGRIHRRSALRNWLDAEPISRGAFGPETLRGRLVLPPGGVMPREEYLAYHHREIFRESLTG